jgi:hypothetical protein
MTCHLLFEQTESKVMRPRARSRFLRRGGGLLIFNLQLVHHLLHVGNGSAFRFDPCSRSARSYSGPNLCCRSLVVLLRFRTYSQASTAMNRITATAITISFGSARLRFVETSLHQECPQNQLCSRNSLCRENVMHLDSVHLSSHCL